MVQEFLTITDSKLKILQQKEQTLIVINNKKFKLERLDKMQIHQIVPKHIIAAFFKKKDLSIKEKEALKKFSRFKAQSFVGKHRGT